MQKICLKKRFLREWKIIRKQFYNLRILLFILFTSYNFVIFFLIISLYRGGIMHKVFILFFLLIVTACSSLPVAEKKDFSSEPRVVQKNVVQPSDAQSKKTVILYPPKVQKYVDNNAAVKQLRLVDAKHAQNRFKHNCTVEKFVAGLNAASLTITKESDNQLRIQTMGGKLGNGDIVIVFNGQWATLKSVEMGKIKQKDEAILEKVAQNLCQAATDKAK